MIFDFGNVGFFAFFNDVASAFYEFIYGLGLCLTIPYDKLFTFQGTATNVFFDHGTTTFNYGLGGLYSYLSGLDTSELEPAVVTLVNFILGLFNTLDNVFSTFGDVVIYIMGYVPGSYPVWRVMLGALPICIVIVMLMNIIKRIIDIGGLG